MQIGKATVENSMAVFLQTESRATIWYCNLTPPGHIPGENSNLKRCMHSNDNLIWCSRRTCTHVLLREIPKSQLVAEQPWTGECQIPPKKIPHMQKAKEKPQQDCRRDTIMFKIKFQTCQRYLRVETKHCAHQDPGKRSSHFHKRLNQTLPLRMWEAPAEARSAVACHRSRGSGCRPGKHGLWPKSFWRR